MTIFILVYFNFVTIDMDMHTDVFKSFNDGHGSQFLTYLTWKFNLFNLEVFNDNYHIDLSFNDAYGS